MKLWQPWLNRGTSVAGHGSRSCVNCGPVTVAGGTGATVTVRSSVRGEKRDRGGYRRRLKVQPQFGAGRLVAGKCGWC